MANKSYAVVFDYETNGLAINELDPLQLACLVIDLHTLTVVPGSLFNSYIRPADIEKMDDTPGKRRALEVNGITRDMVKDAPSLPAVTKAFRDHVKKFGSGPRERHAGGKNIRAFDIPILDRCCREAGIAAKDGTNGLFDNRVVYDIDDDMERWFRWTGIVENCRLDTIRTHFGMTFEGAHDASVDVRQEGWLLIKLLRLYRTLAERVSFAGSAASDGGLLAT